MWSMMYGVGRTPPLSKHNRLSPRQGRLPRCQEQGRVLETFPWNPASSADWMTLPQPARLPMRTDMVLRERDRGRRSGFHAR